MTRRTAVTRYTTNEEQIIAILTQGDAGLTTAELCRQHGITEQTYYRWKAKYGGMESGEAKKLKHVVAELTLDNRALKDVLSKNWYSMSERHACRLMGLARSTRRYLARRPEQDAELCQRLKELAAKWMRFGYPRLTALLVSEEVKVNHKRG